MHVLHKITYCLITVLVATCAWAQSNPLWENIPLKPLSELNTVPVGPADDTLEPIEATAIANASALRVPATIDAEITELAHALNNDPLTIFNYVRNTIRYEHYYGIKKGAALTLLEGSGNDMDQCLLLAQLLEAADLANDAIALNIEYRRGRQRMSVASGNGMNVLNYLGLAHEPYPGQTFEEAIGARPNGWGSLSDLQAKQLAMAMNYIASSGTLGVASWTDYKSLVYYRVWLNVTINGTAYDLDPSLKFEKEIAGIDLLGSTNYARSALLDAAQGSTGAGYVQNLNQSAINTYLSTLNTEMLNLLASNYPNLSLAEIISGRTIVQEQAATLNDCYPLKTIFTNRLNVSNITASLNSYKVKVRFQGSGIDYTINTADLKGRKISLTFNGNTLELRLDDDDLVETGSQSGATFNLKITVTHPGIIGSKSETKSYKKNNAFAYAILYGFSPSGRLLQKRFDQLNAYLDAGKADNSRQVRTELLNIMGLTWLYQTQLSAQMLAAQNDVTHIRFHRFGRMAQEEGFYVDVGLQLSGSRSRNGITENGRWDNVFHLGSLFASAMEHGIIEQMQPGSSAVSTANILRKANAEGQRLYLADASNWNQGANVQNQLSGYSTTQKNEFKDYIVNDNAKLFLPKNNSVTQNQWTGSGWIIRSDKQAGMIINGGYSGGYSTNHGYVSSPSISTSSYYNPTYTYTPPSIPAIKPYVPPSYTTPTFYGSDPVDMATGAFTFSHTDLTTGVEPAPRGLSFTRHYSSAANRRDRQHLGYGWTHMLHMRAAQRTATEEALGLGTVQQAAAMLTATLVASDLYRDEANAKEWGVAALTVGWALDELLDNAVSITIGNNTFQFIEQPNGSFEPPAGSTMELTQDPNGNYILARQHGNTLYFEPTQDSDDESQRIQRMVDPYGKQTTFAYHNDDRIDYVEDTYGRRHTFSYDDNKRIQRITETAGNLSRLVEFRYDSEGNLDRVTDPEGNYFYFDYEVSGDPAQTEAADHRIVRMRNHDNETITQNVYDSLGRVKAQYLHGDTNKTWKLSYTGVENYEQNPAGDITTYIYDERGRSTGKRDPNGNLTTWQYDGQDRIVEKTTGAGETTVYHYDNQHNITRIDHPRGGGSTINVYDILNRLDLVTDPDGYQTDYVYFTNGVHADKTRPQYIIDPAGTTTFVYYDGGPAQGHVWKVTDRDNLVTENIYSFYGQPHSTKAPGGFLTTFKYTPRGDLDYTIDPNGIKTKFTYNNRRQVTQVIYDQSGVDAATEDRTYDNMGNLHSITAPQDNDAQRVQTRFDYSSTEKLRFEYLSNETPTTSDDQIAEYVFDGRDWLDYSIDASGRTTDRSYYRNGDLQHIHRPASRTSSFNYDSDSRLTATTHPGSPIDRVFGYQYTVSNQAHGDLTSGYPKTRFTDADTKTVTSEFDRRGNLRFYTNKHDNVFETRYDGLGRPTHIITPVDAANNRAHTITYTHRGDPATITEPSGQTATYTHDPTTGRLQSVAYSNGSFSETVNYTQYDNNGNLKTLSEGGATIQRTFDNLNRVSSYTDADGNTIGYRYYDSGNIAKIIYPGGSATGTGHVEYTYWKTGRLKQVIDKLDSTTTPRVSEFHWHNDGRLHRIIRPNGTQRRINYDAAGRPATVEELTSTGQFITIHKNHYFPSDEIEWIYQLPQPQTQNATPAVVNAMTYNADNQLATFEGQTVTHDADGNMTHGPFPNGAFEPYYYDTRNRLRHADGLTYFYDPAGERVRLMDQGDTTTYVNENSLGLAKVIQRTNNGQTTRYIWGVGLLYEVDSSGEAIYYHYDNVGSTVALTNESEEVIERIEYAPFGTQTYRERTQGHAGPLHDTPFLWTGFFGNQTDSNGLIYLRNRYYNPLTRRFVNSDPAREGWNWFAYAGGNPIAYVDPTGLGLSSALDSVQTGLSFLGLIPVVGNVFDVVNAGISAARGNYVDASVNLAAALPGIGQAATGAKFAAASVGVVVTTSRVSRGSTFTTRMTKSLRNMGFQEHHIISHTNRATKNHELISLSGFNLQSRANKIFLPKSANLHPTRSLHSGRHFQEVSSSLRLRMDRVAEQGRLGNWVQPQYRDALFNILREERVALRAGDRVLNSITR